MKHLTTILLVILAALSSLSVRAASVIVNGTSYGSSAASVNAAIAKLVAEGTKVFLYTDGTSSVDGTINITGGEIVIRTDKGRSTTSTVANFSATNKDNPLFRISGGNVTFHDPAGGATKGSYRGSIVISGGNVTFASQNNYYEYPVNIAGGTVTIDAGTFGAYYHSSNGLTPNASMGGPALNVLDRGVVTLNGGRFITTASTASCVYSQREAGVVFKTGYALYTTDTNERLTFSNHNFVTPGGTLAADATLKAISYEAVITRGDVSTNYETLAEAWSEAQNSSEPVQLVINGNLSISEPLVFTKGDVSLTTYNNTLSAAEGFGTSPLITVSGGHLTLGPQNTGTTIITNDYGPAIEATGKACVDFGRANVTSAGVPLTFSDDAKVTVQSGTYTCTGADTPIFNITSPNVIIIGGQYVSTAHHVGDFPTASLFAGYTAQSNVDEEVVELTRGNGTLRLPSGDNPTNVRIRSTSKPFDVTTTGGTTTAYGDLALAYALLDPATISSVTLTDDGGITRPISVVSDLTLNLGSHTITATGVDEVLFTVLEDASLTVNANDDGGVQSTDGKTSKIFLSSGAKSIAIHGGHYESTGVVVTGGSAELEITDGYFHSTNAHAISMSSNSKKVTGGRFVTDWEDEDGVRQYAVITAPGNLSADYGYFAPAPSGSGEVELVEHGGPLTYWNYSTDGNASDVTIRHIGPRASVTIGGTTTDYADVRAAFAAAQEAPSATVTLKRDVLLTQQEVVVSKGNITLDMGEYVIAIERSNNLFWQKDDASLTFNRTGLTNRGFPNGAFYFVNHTSTGTLTFNGGQFEGRQFAVLAFNGTTVINDGLFVGTGNYGAISVSNVADVTINGGRFTNSSAAEHSAVSCDGGSLRLKPGFGLGDTDTQTALRRVDGNYVKADGSLAHDISLVQVDPVVYLAVGSGPSTPYGSLASAITAANTHGDTPVNLILIKDVTVSETLDVTGNVTLNLGSNTVTFDPSFEGIGFNVKRGASLAVTANDDGGVRSMGEKTGVLFETREGSKRLAFRGGCYESYGLVVDANNVGDFEIRDGYFHSVNGPAVLIGFNGQNVSGGRFVTDRVDEDGMPYYAVVASSRTSVAPGYAFFAPSLDGEGEVELVAHGGSLEYWGTNSNASDVTVKPVGPYASVSIGGTSTDYNDIFAAFTAAQEAESATVTLKRDVLISGQCIELTKGNITLNMGDYYMASERHGYIFQAGGSVQFTINRTGMTDRGYPNQVYNFIQQTNGTLTINGGYFDGTNCALQVVNGSKAVINGGTFVGNSNAVTVYGALCVINDGRFTARTPGNAAIYAGSDGVVTSGALSMLVDAATRKPIVLAAYEEDVREGSLYSLDAEGHPVADVTTAPATPAFDVTIGGVVSKYADLSTAFIINDPTTVTAARALTDTTIGRTINVTSDFTLDLGSHTATLADGADVLFVVQNDASLTVNANADGGLKALHSKAQVLIHSNDEGANRIAIHGGRYECTGVVLNAWNAKELEITDGYFHSTHSFVAQLPNNSKKVTGGHFVTDDVLAYNGKPNYAVITAVGTIAADYGYFAPAPSGSGEVELVEHSGPLYYWDDGKDGYASDVTIRRAGPRASVTIGGTTTDYGDIFDAFAAAQQAESATVTLKRDILISEKTLELTQGNITLNMGEYYITAERTGHALQVDGTASLTINRTGLTDRGYPHQGGSQYLYNTSTGTLTVNGGYFGGGFFSEASTNLVINGGVFEGYDYALWTYNTKSTLRGGRFVSHDGKNSAIYFGGEEYDCDLDGSHFYATATNEELTIQAAPGIWGSASHAPCDAKGNRVFDVYIATAPASVTTLTHVIDDARHGKATMADIQRAVDAVLLK